MSEAWEELGLAVSRHARRRMSVRSSTAQEVLAVIALCPDPVDPGDGTRLFRARAGGRDLGVVRADDGAIVTVLDFDAAG